MHRLLEEVKRVQNIAPVSRSAGATNGTGVDTAGYDGVAAIFHVGDIGASTTFDGKLQESSDNSNFSDIANAAITQLGASDDNKSPSIDVRLGGRANRKRYVRAVGTVGGSNAVVFGVELLLYGAEQQPQVNSPATVLV